MSRLLACPFCREIFERAEAERCPECDLPLEALHRLPPSLEESEREAVSWERDAPEDVRLPWHHLGNGRGLLLGVAVASLAAFWLAPWIDMISPYAELRTAYALARGRLAWLWGGAVAWLVTLALVLSRRSLNQMRGVRAILVFFASVTLSEIALLVLLSPRGSRQIHVEYEWAWGLYVSLGLSLVGALAALRFGVGEAPAEATRTEPMDGTAGSTLH